MLIPLHHLLCLKYLKLNRNQIAEAGWLNIQQHQHKTLAPICHLDLSDTNITVSGGVSIVRHLGMTLRRLLVHGVDLNWQRNQSGHQVLEMYPLLSIEPYCAIEVPQNLLSTHPYDVWCLDDYDDDD